MNDILKKADCCDNNTYNCEIVAKIMYVLLTMKCEKPNEITNTITNKLNLIKNSPYPNTHILKDFNIYTLLKYNLVIYVSPTKNSRRCPFKSKESTTYDGFDFGGQYIIIDNLSISNFEVMNTLDIHRIYYHNDVKNGINLEKLEKILKNVPNFKMTISYKNELVYSNILDIMVHDYNYIRGVDPLVSYGNDNWVVGFFKSIKKLTEYNNHVKNITKLGMIKNIRHGKQCSDKVPIYIFPFVKDDILHTKEEVPDYYIIEFSKSLYHEFGIKLCYESSSWKLGYVSKFFPVMKDIYYYHFE